MKPDVELEDGGMMELAIRIDIIGAIPTGEDDGIGIQHRPVSFGRNKHGGALVCRTEFGFAELLGVERRADQRADVAGVFLQGGKARGLQQIDAAHAKLVLLLRFMAQNLKTLL